ncbi:NTP transferase domain-containing protein [Phaeobacter sp. B1627]|uniref:nucleotidyltransferase family protein n=1 Tax=Phaeobacter sp. B1627 TaxID=2583809 RepID=UPI001118699B|nr:nucleotidyltransferase family protein [Phaeobacter sp. B1627]TNJ48389.1 nucleotidyltransferase family protein [Phaeobacter sp. B1627]
MRGASVATILLAAGQSLRMGARNKLLLPISGIPMIRHMVLCYRAASDGEVLVVTGHEAGAIEEAIAGTHARPLFNPDYAQGQQSSVICGLTNAAEAEAILIGLGDQPLLTPTDLRDLISAHRAAGGDKISIPMKEDQRGNPIVVPATLRARLLADPKGPGCKRFTRTQAEHVQPLQMTAPGFFADVDTPAAYAALTAPGHGGAP